ncbi:MAG: hypothetical protein GX568_00090 [Candidatus Gastranaerophilales bacterium]|nr:hypothetical protein [Candidatus Gastranaerophilales bacterium]
MTWQERFNQIQEQAQRTNEFAYSKYVQELYFRLLGAIEQKDSDNTKKLIVKMGF